MLGAMETPQHGNASTRNRTQKNGNLPKMNILRRFLFFQKFSEIPQIQFLEEFPVFFYPFPRFLGRIPVYQGLILLRDFPIFLRDFPIFSIRFLIFWVRFRFSKKNLILSLLIGFLFFWVRFLFVGFVSDFQKKL